MSEFLARFAGPMASEIAGEVGTALALSGRRLQAKLDLLKRYDADPSVRQFQDRERLVSDAAESLWGYVVQREIIGLRDVEYIVASYQVPPDVRKRMDLGPQRPPRAT